MLETLTRAAIILSSLITTRVEIPVWECGLGAGGE